MTDAELEQLAQQLEQFKSELVAIIAERDSFQAKLTSTEARAEEAERIIRNGEEQTAALKRLVPFCHHPANLVIGSAEGWICCECWAQQNEDALRKIAALPTDQTASPTQCEAVLIAMDALESSPSVRPDEAWAREDSTAMRMARALKEADLACGDLAEQLAEDMDHRRKDHSTWYKHVQAYRKARTP